MGSFVMKRELQGPRPPPLKVYKESYKVKKPQATRHNINNPPQPVVIHIESPEIIHVKPQDFMNLVQQLTGKPTTPRYGSIGSLMDDCRACGIVSSSVETQRDREVKEEINGTVVAHGVSVPSTPSSLRSPMFPSNLFTPSPSAYTNLLDFGPIF